MIKIRDKRTRKVVRVELSPGEQQYLASHNLKQVAPDAWKKVKENGRIKWLERKAQGNIGLHLKDDSTQER